MGKSIVWTVVFISMFIILGLLMMFGRLCSQKTRNWLMGKWWFELLCPFLVMALVGHVLAAGSMLIAMCLASTFFLIELYFFRRKFKEFTQRWIQKLGKLKFWKRSK